MPEALAALIVYDPEADVATNAATMAGGGRSSRPPGEVTQAVRDSGGPAGPVTARGSDRAGGIGTVERSPAPLTRRRGRLLDHLVGDTREIVTIIEGVGSDAATTQALRGSGSNAPACGGGGAQRSQPLYPYLFGVE